MATIRNLAALGVVATLAGTAAAQEPVNVLSAPFGTGSYVIANALEQISKAHDGPVQVVAQESPGFVFNIKKLEADEAARANTVIGTGAVVSTMAQRGEGPFDAEHAPVLLLGNYSLASTWLVTLDPEIQSVADLEGRTIGLGRAPQINWAVEPETLMRVGWGLEDINVEYLGPPDAIAALLDGRVDAAVVGAYANAETSQFVTAPPTTELLASGRDLIHLPWGEEAVQRVIDSGMPIAGFTVPGGAIEGMESDFAGFVDSAAWAASPEFPEETAYKIVSMILANIDRFGEYAATGDLMSKRGLVFGWSEDRIHPGALRAYREAGVID